MAPGQKKGKGAPERKDSMISEGDEEEEDEYDDLYLETRQVEENKKKQVQSKKSLRIPKSRGTHGVDSMLDDESVFSDAQSK